MIWYLLYPIRKTSEPPSLPPDHPIRRAFRAYGTATARHWLLSILLTVVLSVLLCYPAIFQTDSPAATGLRNLPKHVWTSTTEVEGDRQADVQVRQVWVHGDYMKAIQHRVLREALHVQASLIANGFDEVLGPTPDAQLAEAHGDEACVATKPGQKWGVHSPLMYWGCSQRMLDEDRDLLATINARAGSQSELNITLRPSTVFAGKEFVKAKLRSADAIVITLFDQTVAGLGPAWETRSQQLAQNLPSDWSMFPRNGKVDRSRLYEFRFKPMTFNDDLFLSASYMVTAVYVIMRMMQLRAVKSWFGLLITVGAKMTVCIIGSFTICSFLGINLARIPRPWFPGVVFCFGLGNMSFRLINVVLETPAEMPSPQRIGHALGRVGHLSIAVAGQNLVIIYLCSRVVTPWVADFCIFAAVTLVLDLAFHLTFFVAVLSVDVQRMELSDSLDRIDMNQLATKNRKTERQSWFSAFFQGTLPVSTRYAGSVAILSFLMAINWHFFDSSGQSLSVHTIKEKLLRRQSRPMGPKSWSPPFINQARSPADWLRLQDHNTAAELFGLIKPNAHSFVARIYDPLLIVSKNATGRDVAQKSASLTESFRHFARGHAYSAALIVAFLIAGVTLLMNYLLWTGLPESVEEEESEDSVLRVWTLSGAQALDIVQLTSSPKGHVASISLDRTTSIWFRDQNGFRQSMLQTVTMKPRLWPIIASTMDDGGSMLALYSSEGFVGFWNLSAARFSTVQTIDLRGQVPLLFTFATIPQSDQDLFTLLIVTPDGILIEYEPRGGVHRTRRICTGAIVCVKTYVSAKGELSLVFVTRTGEVHILSLDGNREKTSEVVAGLDPGPPPGSNPLKIRCIEAVPTLGLIFALRDEEAEVFDFTSRGLIYAFQIGHVKPHSFRVTHSALRQCSCGAPAVHSLSVAYTEEGTDHLIMQSFSLDESPTSLMCLGKPSENEAYSCRGLGSAEEVIHMVEPAGVWEAIASLGLIGIRRCNHSPAPASVASDGGYEGPEPSAIGAALQDRAIRYNKNRADQSLMSGSMEASDNDGWEAWTLSISGDFRSRPLAFAPHTDTDELHSEQLFVAAPGPIAKVGKKSVAVGFGNTVKIITVGKEKFEGLGASLEVRMVKHKSRIRRGPGRKVQ